MIFNDRFKYVLMPTILVHGEPLKRVSNFKYLGCILIDDLYDGADMERAMSAFNKSFGIFFQKILRAWCWTLFKFISVFLYIFLWCRSLGESEKIS